MQLVLAPNFQMQMRTLDHLNANAFAFDPMSAPCVESPVYL